jgi:hypothetical protein
MRRSVVYCIYILVLLSAAFAALEFVLRVFRPDGFVPPFFEYDAASIVVPRMNTFDGVHWRTNDLGGRGGALDPIAETVLVFGDSNIAARYLDEANTFPGQLAQLISPQVANFGMVGYGPDQSVLRLKSLLRSGRPLGQVKAVILHVFADNDLGDLIRNALPEFEPRPDMRGGTPRSTPDFLFPQFATSTSYVVRRIFWWISNSRFGPLVFPIAYYHPSVINHVSTPAASYLQQIVDEQLREFREYQKGNYTHWAADHFDAAIALEIDPELTAAATSILDRVLQEFLKLSKQRDFCPVVLVQPSKVNVEINWDMNRELLADYARRRGHSYNPQHLSHLIEQASIRLGLPTVPLFDSFSRGHFYGSGRDDHWSQVGTKEAARLAAYELRRSCSYFADK